MLYAGCDLHKQTITICVVNQMGQILLRRRLLCADEAGLRRFFEELGRRESFQLVVEATASYEWFARQVPLLVRLQLGGTGRLAASAMRRRRVRGASNVVRVGSQGWFVDLSHRNCPHNDAD